MNSQQYGASYNFFLAPLEVLGSTNLKQMKFNRKKIRLVAMVMLVIGLFFGFYAAFGGSFIASEYGLATTYFEHSNNVIVTHVDIAYYYFAWWSPSHGNAQQSVINAIYASGLGFIINGVMYLVGEVTGGQPLSGTAAINFVAGFIVALFFNWGAQQALVVAVNEAVDAGATAEEVAAIVASSSVLAPAIAGFLAGYMAILGAE
jgi:hypothetical protein